MVLNKAVNLGQNITKTESGYCSHQGDCYISHVLTTTTTYKASPAENIPLSCVKRTPEMKNLNHY